MCELRLATPYRTEIAKGVVIWKPSQILEESEEGASSRKGDRPFAFAPIAFGYAQGDRADVMMDDSGRICSAIIAGFVAAVAPTPLAGLRWVDGSGAARRQKRAG